MKIAMFLLISVLLAAGCIHEHPAPAAPSEAQLGRMELERLGFSQDNFKDGETKAYRVSVENTFNTSISYRIEFIPEDDDFISISRPSVSFDSIASKERTAAKVVEITVHTPVARVETLLSLRLYAKNGEEILVEERNLTITITKG